MSVRRTLLPLCAVAAAAALTALPGCALLEPWGQFWHEVKRNAKPSGEDARDYTEEKQEEWKVVGKEGRKGQHVEKDPDQWYRKYIMSEKAREIEENLGFE